MEKNKLPTQDPSQTLTLDQAREFARNLIVGDEAEQPVPSGSPGRIGLEPEMFAVRVRENGPPERLPIWGPGGACEILDEEAREGSWLLPRDGGAVPSYPVAKGGKITFEPGGQIEYSTAPVASATKVLSETRDVLGNLCKALASKGVNLLSMGIDPWSSAEDVSPQLNAPRYFGMAKYFDKIGPSGAVMMRNTASVQVNLDNGEPGARDNRWRLAFLMSPVLTASFAASPGKSGPGAWGVASKRALAWQKLDPSRTGFPRGFISKACKDVGAAYVAAALAADVMLFLPASVKNACNASTNEMDEQDHAARSGNEPIVGSPGFSFERWILEGHPQGGRPTAADLKFHMSTLFFEVRLRGFMELRAADASPFPCRTALAAFAAGLLYDNRAADKALDILDPYVERLPELWARAAYAGLRDGILGALSQQLWTIALEGAKSLPEGYFGQGDIRRAEEYQYRYVMKGRMPADELREAMASNIAEGVFWANEA